MRKVAMGRDYIRKRDKRRALRKIKRQSGLITSRFIPSKKGLARRAAFLKRSTKPIARVSERQKIRLVEYAKVKRRFLRTHTVCEVSNCYEKATDLHHSRGRSGRLLTDVLFFIALCRDHHNWAHEYPEDAKRIGLFGPWGKQTP